MPENANDAHEETTRIRKGLTAISGGVVLFIGIIAIPYPGPGWLIVFAGLAILGREFAWANRILKTLRTRYDKFELWVKQQGRPVQLLMFLITSIFVVTTLWIINAYGVLVTILGLDWPWARSPFLW